MVDTSGTKPKKYCVVEKDGNPGYYTIKGSNYDKTALLVGAPVVNCDPKVLKSSKSGMVESVRDTDLYIITWTAGRNFCF